MKKPLICAAPVHQGENLNNPQPAIQKCCFTGKSPTMRDVAALAEVSLTAISMVMNNDPRIAEMTRRKVLAVVENLNYRMDENARALSLKKNEKRERGVSERVNLNIPPSGLPGKRDPGVGEEKKPLHYPLERRNFNRVKFQKAVKIFQALPNPSGDFYEFNNAPLDAWTNNISEGGLLLETACAFEPNLILKLIFENERHQPVKLYGKIVWSYDNHCGVRIMHLDKILPKVIGTAGEKTGSSAMVKK
jgi:hypothetical protein